MLSFFDICFLNFVIQFWDSCSLLSTYQMRCDSHYLSQDSSQLFFWLFDADLSSLHFLAGYTLLILLVDAVNVELFPFLSKNTLWSLFYLPLRFISFQTQVILLPILLVDATNAELFHFVSKNLILMNLISFYLALRVISFRTQVLLVVILVFYLFSSFPQVWCEVTLFPSLSPLNLHY